MRAAFVYDEGFLKYDFGPSHPLRPERLSKTRGLIEDLGGFNQNCCVVSPRIANEAELLSIHSAEYLREIQRLSASRGRLTSRGYGFEFPDNPPFAGMWEASLLYTGASITAAELVLAGEATAAFNISGGLHHAMYSSASGFCVINDCVAAIHRLLEGVEKVAYVDIDAHHGDGVQAAFYSSPRVLTVSIHESGRYLFPGSGFPEEVGEGEGFGHSVNVPLPPGTGDDVYMHAFDEVVPPLLSAFKPDALVTQLGADSHSEDPLAHLNVSTATYEHAFRFFKSLGIPWVALGGGGYNVNSVSRIWTIAWFIMCGGDVPDALPPEVCSRHGISYLRDPMRTVSSGAVRDSVNATLQRVKQLVFPVHGL